MQKNDDPVLVALKFGDILKSFHRPLKVMSEALAFKIISDFKTYPVKGITGHRG